MTTPAPVPPRRLSGPLVLGGFLVLVLLMVGGFWWLSRQPERQADGAPTPAQPLAPGRALMQKYRCYTCHHDDGQFTGPSLRQLATRYQAADDAQRQTLVAKVRAGGQGNWGRSPMPAHEYIREADLRTMVDYILTLAPPAPPPPAD